MVDGVRPCPGKIWVQRGRPMRNSQAVHISPHNSRTVIYSDNSEREYKVAKSTWPLLCPWGAVTSTTTQARCPFYHQTNLNWPKISTFLHPFLGYGPKILNCSLQYTRIHLAKFVWLAFADVCQRKLAKNRMRYLTKGGQSHQNAGPIFGVCGRKFIKFWDIVWVLCSFQCHFPIVYRPITFRSEDDRHQSHR